MHISHQSGPKEDSNNDNPHTFIFSFGMYFWQSIFALGVFWLETLNSNNVNQRHCEDSILKLLKRCSDLDTSSHSGFLFSFSRLGALNVLQASMFVTFLALLLTVVWSPFSSSLTENTFATFPQGKKLERYIHISIYFLHLQMKIRIDVAERKNKR